MLGVYTIEFNAVGRPNISTDRREPSGSERRRVVDNRSAGQYAESRIEMIKPWIDERKCNAAYAKHLLNHLTRRGVRAGAAADPEQITAGIEDAVSGTLEWYMLRHLGDCADQSARLQDPEAGREHRLFTLPLGMAEARQ